MEASLQDEKMQAGWAVMDPQHELHASPRAHAEAAVKEPGRRMVYLLSRYPAVSHTFFFNEIGALRKLGFTIEAASINEPDRLKSAMPEAEAVETERTFYIKSMGAAGAVWIALKTLLTRPRVFARGFLAALRLGGLTRLDIGATVYTLFYFVEALILGDWMRSRGQRHLHIHFCGPVATVGMLTSIAWELPYSLTVHGPDEFFDVEKFYLQQKVEQAQFIVCISEFCRSQLMRLVAPEHWQKMQVVRLGVDPEVFVPPQRTREPGEALEILCVGRLVGAKGQLVLLQACELLVAQGYSLRVRLVGAGPDRIQLEAYAGEKGLPVIFEGARNHDETRKLLGGAEVFALASFAEGVPVALMEAMAMEVPCVSTYVAGIPELIRDGVDGLLMPASSTEALASALRRLLDDPILRRSLGVAGNKRVNEHYNLPQNVRLLAQVFREHLPDSN